MFKKYKNSINRRISKFIQYLVVRYIPSTKRISHLESKRLAIFISENYDVTQYENIISGIKLHLKEFLKEEKNKTIEENNLNNINISNMDKVIEILSEENPINQN